MEDQNQNLRQRVRDDEPMATADGGDTADGGTTADSTVVSREKRREMAKRGLRTLGVAVLGPVLVSLMNIYYFGANDTYKMGHRPSWVPPIWALHVSCLGSTMLMAFCGWAVWAEGGLDRIPRAMYIYMGGFGLSMVWDPLVFKLGLNSVGLVVAVGVCWASYQCSRMFKQVSQIAGDFMLPCMAWSALLAFVNLKLMLA